MVLSPTPITLPIGTLRRVHHIALNVKDMEASRLFYGEILGLHELTGQEVPETLRSLVAQGKVANFITPDGTVLDLFWEPELTPPNPDPTQQFTRANHLAFDIAPELFEQAVAVLHENQIAINHGFLIEIRCDPVY
jgi:glyoxylase I family protein